MKKHKDRAHAWLSPSSWHRILECKASPIVSEGIETEASEAALKGTKGHEWAEKLMQALAEENTKKYEILCREYEAEDSDLFDLVDGYIDFCDTLKDRFQSDKFDDYEEFIEVKGEFTPLIWGTLDYGLTRTNGKINQTIISDFKSGFHVVPAKDNPQLILYLIILEEKLKIRFDKVWMYIYQPRVPREKPFDKAVITRSEVDNWRNKFLKLENEIKQLRQDYLITGNLNVLPFKVGDHCKFCPYQIHCKEFKNHVKNESLLVLDGTDNLPGFVSNNLPVPNKFIDQLVRIHKQKKAIEHYLENIDHFLLHRGMRGQYIGDLKVVNGRSQRKWINDQELIVETLKEHGLNPFKKKLINFGEAEKIVGKKVINSLTTKPPGKLQLALADDERESASIGKDSISMLDDLPVDQY